MDQKVVEATGFGVGVDTERAGRFDIGVDNGILQALFAPEERQYCSASSDAAASFAGTWCAKEAVVKALAPWVALDPRRVIVVRTVGDTQVVVTGWNGAARGVTVRVSISDDRPLATAFAVAFGPGIADLPVGAIPRI